MSNNHNCLNCGQPIVQNYCANCGQKASTHRFSLRHLIEHDIIHGIFHLDKGFLYTAKALLTRPGYSIREYIDGKRVQHFNPITFILLMAAVNIFLMTAGYYDMMDMISRESGKTLDKSPLQFAEKHMKEFYLLLIPVYSLITLTFFRRARQNYAEHIVMNAYKECGTLMINSLIAIVVILSKNKTVAIATMMGNALIIYTYSIWFYRQYFSKDYRNKTLLTVRIMFMQFTFISMVIALALAGLYIYAFFTDSHVVWQAGQAIIVK